MTKCMQKDTAKLMREQGKLYEYFSATLSDSELSRLDRLLRIEMLLEIQKCIVMDEETFGALKSIVEYVFDAEREHYQECEEEEKQNHVFDKMEKVASWIAKETK